MEDGIRNVPGYEDFLQPLSFAQIARLASSAPLVYLLSTSQGGLALVAAGEQVRCVWLPVLTEPNIREKIYGPANGHELGGYLDDYDRWRSDSSNGTVRQSWMIPPTGYGVLRSRQW